MYDLPPMAVAIVARKSTRDEAKVSVTRQEEWGREWAAANHPGEQVLVFSDNAKSGTDMDRGGWTGFTQAVQSGVVTVVWTWEQSRITRAGEVAWLDVCLLLYGAGIRHVDTHRQGRISVVEGDRIHGGVNSVIDQHYRELARVNTLDGLAHLARQGRPGGATGYGYRRSYGDDGRPVLEPDPKQAREVVRMVKAIASGSSLGVVVDNLNRRQVPTPSGGARWRRDSVRAIVTSPRIVGKRIHQGKIAGDAMWPAIVDEKMWKQARARLQSNRPGTTRDDRRRYLLTGGLARCAHCDTPLIASTTAVRGVRLPAYACPHPSRPDGGCGKCSILADRLERFVHDDIGESFRDPAWVDSMNAALAASGPEREPLQQELERIDGQLEALAVKWATGDLLDVEHQAARSVLVDARRDIEGKLYALPDVPEADVAALARLWSTDSVTDRRDVLVALLEVVTVRGAFADGRRLALEERVEIIPR